MALPDWLTRLLHWLNPPPGSWEALSFKWEKSTRKYRAEMQFVKPGQETKQVTFYSKYGTSWYCPDTGKSALDFQGRMELYKLLDREETKYVHKHGQNHLRYSSR